MTVSPLDAATAELFTGDNPATATKDLRAIIEHAILNQPRSLQKRIGPSELGAECDRCLISKLAGIEEKRDVAWLPFIGTAVHNELESIVLTHEGNKAKARIPMRYMPECRVTVGVVGGTEITGSTDVFDIATGTVIDYKIVGKTTLVAAKARGASLVYQRQLHLYGKGWQDAGYQVTSVAVWFLPRNEPTIANAVLWQVPYDRQIAIKTIARADMFATAITAFGPAQVLADAPPHTGGFSCARFPREDGTYPPPPNIPHQRTQDAFADLIAS